MFDEIRIHFHDICTHFHKKLVKATTSNPDNGMHASMCGSTTYQAICVCIHKLTLHAVDVSLFATLFETYLIILKANWDNKIR